jgi:hypothetical protein
VRATGEAAYGQGLVMGSPVLGRRCRERASNGADGAGSGPPEVKGGADAGGSDTDRGGDTDRRRRWRKLSETKWWACGDCWPCGENLGLRYEIKCSLVNQ